MTEEELIRQFESTELSGEAFTHAEHVRAAWSYLRRHPLPEALRRFSTALRRFATVKGAPDKYHETMTVAFVLIIADRMHASAEASWTAFIAANADLLERKPSVLGRYYSDALLDSPRARQVFVMPDLLVPASGNPALAS